VDAAAAVDVVAAERGEATVAEDKKSKTLKITWVRSGIGYRKGQRDTIQSLGLHRLNQTVEQADTPQVRGQINKVRHMLKVEEA
jgi:large subunit ribosomal protein L30